jgi:asparagine synthase (glutamine-hydrolysing)
MPGITGIIGVNSIEGHAHRIRLMTDVMLHEPFYSSGTYINESLKVCVGWVSHPNSFTDCMPIWNETKDVCIFFSGEDFTETEVIEQLRTRGHSCDDQNANYIVHLYEELGDQFFQKLNGWFSGLILDLRRKNIFLFNDRFGLQRIYYHEHPTGLYFSSEAKSLLKVLPDLRKIDYNSLAETFSCGCVLENRTLFSNINLLPGGSLWTFNGFNKVKKDKYFSPEVWEKQSILSAKEYNDELKQRFVRILPKYFRSKVQIGMSLTGGLDGRLMMAWTNHQPNSLPCYTFNGTYRDCFDVKIARQVAELCHQPHQTIVVDSQFFGEFPELAEKAVYLSDGTMDVIGSVELYANRFARQIAPVRLTGNYGSEIVRGNVAFRPDSFNEELITSDFSRLIRNASETYLKERQISDISFIAFKQVPWHHYARFSVEQSQLTIRSPYLDNDLVALMYQAPRELIDSPVPTLRLIAEGNLSLSRIPTDRGLLYKPIPLLSKGNHLCQIFTAKAEYAYDYGMPQWLSAIDQRLSPLHLEHLFLGRHKFCHFRVWYRDKLSQYVKEILLDSRSLARPYVNKRNIEMMVEKHTSGKRNYTSELHRLLTAELLQRRLIEWR